MGKDLNRMDTMRSKRKNGRQKIWRDDTEEKAGKTWPHIASDQMTWKGLLMKSAKSGMND